MTSLRGSETGPSYQDQETIRKKQEQETEVKKHKKMQNANSPKTDTKHKENKLNMNGPLFTVH